MLGGDTALQCLDFRTGKFDDLAAFDIHHVVVVFATVQLIDRLAAFEIVLQHQSRSFKLGQHAIDRGQANLVPVVQQVAIDVLGRHVPGFGLLQQFKDTHPWVRDLQADLA